ESGMTPWMAGGGSTVRSIPATKSLEPFIGQYGPNKLGAYVVMADGSVRFVKAGTPDKVFQDMCTIGAKSPTFDADVDGATEKVPAPNVPVAPVPPKEEKNPPTPPQPQAGVPAGWKQYTYPDGKFSVM